MNKSIKTVLYFFRNPVESQLKLVRQKKMPKDYFYFLHYVKKFFTVKTQGIVYQHKFVYWLHLSLDKIMHILFGFDFPIIPLIGLKLKPADILFATTPKLGLMFCLYKKMGKYREKLIINIVGLYDQLKDLKNPLTLFTVKSLLPEVDGFVAGSSWHECQKLAKFFNIPLTKFTFAPYSGIDTDFFSKNRLPEKNFILGIGIDPSRDWLLYREVALSLPFEQFVWATDPKLINFLLPANVEVKYFPSMQLSEKIEEAELILILTRFNHHFSGQASAMRAMSLAKTVILTITPGIEEFRFDHFENCLMVKPDDTVTIVKLINKLTQQPKLRQKIGRSAAKLVRRHYEYKKIGRLYVDLFNNQLSDLPILTNTPDL